MKTITFQFEEWNSWRNIFKWVNEIKTQNLAKNAIEIKTNKLRHKKQTKHE